MTTEPPPSLLFERPVVVLSAPRSGSTLVFETLSAAPDLYTIGGESHRALESVPALRLEAHGFESNRLVQGDATPGTIAQVTRNFAALLRDRAGRPPRGWPVRVLEKTPKNCLRVPFLRALWPDARFVVLLRRPEATIGSMIDAWQSGRFVTYPYLPGWNGPPWSLLLVPGWRELAGRPIEDIAAYQWAKTIEILLDDLAGVPPSQVLAVRYETFLEDTRSTIARICEFAGLGWDRPVDALPLSRHTLTPPSTDKWRRHARSIEAAAARFADAAARAEALLARAGASMP